MPTDRNFNIRLGDRRREKLRRIAVEREISMSDVVRGMIDRAPEPLSVPFNCYVVGCHVLGPHIHASEGPASSTPPLPQAPASS